MIALKIIPTCSPMIIKTKILNQRYLEKLLTLFTVIWRRRQNKKRRKMKKMKKSRKRKKNHWKFLYKRQDVQRLIRFVFSLTSTSKECILSKVNCFKISKYFILSWRTWKRMVIIAMSKLLNITYCLMTQEKYRRLIL